MTREEVVEEIENAVGLIKQNGKDWLDERDIPFLESVIKALEQEPCGDAISRQAVLEALRAMYDTHIIETEDGDEYIDYNDTVYEIEKLPPVKSAEKVGHWIDHQEDRWIYAKCSECGTIHDTRTNYCPHCGAKMGGEQNV